MSGTLRDARDELVADARLRGAAFGRALANLVDHAVVDAFGTLPRKTPWALLALGSYARRELCPGSDVDIMLLHDSGRKGSALAQQAARCWYPLWDAGFVLGHSARTIKDALALADSDLDALTSILDMRIVAGDEALAGDLALRAHRLGARRRDRLITELATASTERLVQPGPIAEVLEPNLKNGAGGLRDVQSPGWIGWTLDREGPQIGALSGGSWLVGLETLAGLGYLHDDDPTRLRDARDRLLDARVALHRVSGSRSDQLTLQEQDAVAEQLGIADADTLVRAIGEASRSVTWIMRDVWTQLLRADHAAPAIVDEVLDQGIVVRDGRAALAPDAPIDLETVLRLGVVAASREVLIDRPTLARIQELADPQWTGGSRAQLVELLRCGRRAVPVFESLDHVGLLVRMLPEWGHVRARPQRNAYHRFTVDRHSFEAVAECAALLDPDDARGAGFDGDIARRPRVDLLLFSALLHDIGKGHPGDHSEVGSQIARDLLTRIGLDEHGVDTVEWLVRHHLLMADTATRRDLSDPITITRFGRAVGDTERLDLLYGLTLGDSRATGPGAWSLPKGTLVRDLFSRTDALLETGVAHAVEAERARFELRALVGAAEADGYLDGMPASYAGAFPAPTLAQQRALIDAAVPTVVWDEVEHDRIRCTVVVRDRTGLLARVSTELALLGFDIDSAAGYSHVNGFALEVFVGRDRFGRLGDARARDAASANVLAAATGTLSEADVRARALRERAARYRPRTQDPAERAVRVGIDTEASTETTVVEVEAPDDVGVLATVAQVFADAGFDVEQAMVTTIGTRVVDVFYLRRHFARIGPRGEACDDADELAALHDALVERLAVEARSTEVT